MDDIGQFLFLLAFVIIAAIQWVVKQIQERNAPPKEEVDPLEETWKELEDYHEQRRLGEEEAAESRRLERERESRKPAAVSPFQELRNLFESLAQTGVAKVPQPPERVVVLPREEVVVREEAESSPYAEKSGGEGEVVLTEAEQEALRRLDAKSVPTVQRKPSRVADGGFRDLLRGAFNLRRALILKEVFDRPLALRPGHTGNSPNLEE